MSCSDCVSAQFSYSAHKFSYASGAMQITELYIPSHHVSINTLGQINFYQSPNNHCSNGCVDRQYEHHTTTVKIPIQLVEDIDHLAELSLSIQYEKALQVEYKSLKEKILSQIKPYFYF